ADQQPSLTGSVRAGNQTGWTTIALPGDPWRGATNYGGRLVVHSPGGPSENILMGNVTTTTKATGPEVSPADVSAAFFADANEMRVWLADQFTEPVSDQIGAAADGMTELAALALVLGGSWRPRQEEDDGHDGDRRRRRLPVGNSR